MEDVTAIPADVRAGKTAYMKEMDDPGTGTMPDIAGRTITPGASQQSVGAGGYLAGNIVVPGFALPAANLIKKGTTINIYGRTVTGTYEGYYVGSKDAYNQGTWAPGLSPTIQTGTLGPVSIIPSNYNYHFQFTKNLYGLSRVVLEGIGFYPDTSEYRQRLTLYKADNTQYTVMPASLSTVKMVFNIDEIIQAAGTKPLIFSIASQSGQINSCIKQIYFQ